MRTLTRLRIALTAIPRIKNMEGELTRSEDKESELKEPEASEEQKELARAKISPSFFFPLFERNKEKIGDSLLHNSLFKYPYLANFIS